jgi:hypothetical protein
MGQLDDDKSHDRNHRASRERNIEFGFVDMDGTLRRVGSIDHLHARLPPSACERRHLRQTQLHGGPNWQSAHLTYRALSWRVPAARFSQFRDGGKADEANYSLWRRRRRNSGLVVEKR